MPVRSFFTTICVATVVALVVRCFLIEDFRIQSESMVPNLFTGDLVLVSKYVYNIRLPFSNYEVVKIRRPKRSEIVAFTLPGRGIETFVKRVVALEGDSVAIDAGAFLVNGEKLAARNTLPIEEKGELGTYVMGSSAMGNYGPITVPPGHFFALGDNRGESEDSRTWGPIPYSCLKGRVSLVWLSLDPKGGFRKERSGLLPR